jgi:hypothetical protein
VKVNRVQGDIRFSKRCILHVLNGLSVGLGMPLRLTIAAGMIFFGYQSPVNAQLTILHNFGDGTVAKDGADPEAGLIQAPNGEFFGVTTSQATAPNTVAGTVFRMSKSGALHIIYRFGSKSNTASTELLYYKGALVGIASKYAGDGTLFALTHSTTGRWQFSSWYKFGGASELVYPAGMSFLVQTACSTEQPLSAAPTLRDSLQIRFEDASGDRRVRILD